MNIDLKHGDCLELMSDIPDGSVDMIFCDLPYGTTACSWDTVIPFVPMWEQYKRIIKDNGAIVLFGSQPFTSILCCSNLPMFRYEWIWEKSRGSNFVHANYQPLKTHENLLVFSKSGAAQGSKLPIKYNKQFVSGNPYKKGTGHAGMQNMSGGYTNRHKIVLENSSGDRYPRSVIYYATAESEGIAGFHPTQKPVYLCEYIIKTYTDEGETVLDNCMGSGTIGVACVNTNRNFIGIEKVKKYFDISVDRINTARENIETSNAFQEFFN